jgi:hypothetical protein
VTFRQILDVLGGFLSRHAFHYLLPTPSYGLRCSIQKAAISTAQNSSVMPFSSKKQRKQGHREHGPNYESFQDHQPFLREPALSGRFRKYPTVPALSGNAQHVFCRLRSKTPLAADDERRILS